MSLTHIIVLALIQGLTEFLPVSSSAHLIFPSQILGWPDQGLAFDVAVHVGTLLAVLVYYARDVSMIALSTLRSCVTFRQDQYSKLGWFVILATIPAGLCGIIFEHEVATIARSIHVIAVTTIGFGLLLGLASLAAGRRSRRQYFNDYTRPDDLKKLGLGRALIIGFAQALALIPGTSRSGITMTAAMFLGLKPAAAARFSFLLSIPVIAASGLLEGIKVVRDPVGTGADLLSMGLGAGLSFIIALVVISLFMRFIARSGMAIFVIYRLILGGILLALA